MYKASDENHTVGTQEPPSKIRELSVFHSAEPNEYFALKQKLANAERKLELLQRSRDELRTREAKLQIDYVATLARMKALEQKGPALSDKTEEPNPGALSMITELRELQKQRDARNAEVAMLRERLSRLEQSALGEQTSLTKQVESLKRALTKAEDRLERLRNSLSWRITQPLRAVWKSPKKTQSNNK